MDLGRILRILVDVPATLPAERDPVPPPPEPTPAKQPAHADP
jgi:hypothetical protein